MALVRVRLSAPAPVAMLPVTTDLELLLAPVTVRVSPLSAESLLEPSVTLPVIVEVLSTLTPSAPLPVTTLPVMVEALRVRMSALPLVVSPSLPRVTLPATEEATLREMESEPEPVVIAAVMAVPEAFNASMPSLLL